MLQKYSIFMSSRSRCFKPELDLIHVILYVLSELFSNPMKQVSL